MSFISTVSRFAHPSVFVLMGGVGFLALAGREHLKIKKLNQSHLSEENRLTNQKKAVQEMAEAVAGLGTTYPLANWAAVKALVDDLPQVIGKVQELTAAAGALAKAEAKALRKHKEAPQKLRKAIDAFEGAVKAAPHVDTGPILEMLGHRKSDYDPRKASEEILAAYQDKLKPGQEGVGGTATIRGGRIAAAPIRQGGIVSAKFYIPFEEICDDLNPEVLKGKVQALKRCAESVNQTWQAKTVSTNPASKKTFYLFSALGLLLIGSAVALKVRPQLFAQFRIARA